jgi:hypothetical protein
MEAGISEHPPLRVDDAVGLVLGHATAAEVVDRVRLAEETPVWRERRPPAEDGDELLAGGRLGGVERQVRSRVPADVEPVMGTRQLDSAVGGIPAHDEENGRGFALLLEQQLERLGVMCQPTLQLPSDDACESSRRQDRQQVREILRIAALLDRKPDATIAVSPVEDAGGGDRRPVNAPKRRRRPDPERKEIAVG